MSRLRNLTACVLGGATIVATAWTGAVQAQAGPAAQAPTTVVSVVPGTTPSVNDGQVSSIAQVGNQIVLGGTFTSVTRGPTTYQRSGVVAFDATTGQISASFAPVFNGVVETVEPGPTAGTVYVGGRFTKMNDVSSSHVALVNLATGTTVPGFKPVATNGAVTELAVVDGRLILGGTFTTAGGVAHGGLASFNATTGALDAFINNQFTSTHNTGTGATAAIGVSKFDVTPDGDRLVAIGNFRFVDGLDRDQVVMLSLDGASSTVTTDWQTNRYKPLCFNWAYASYVRGVDVSPDGSYFVVGTTGGGNTGTLCDSVARFETRASGTNLQPTWVDYAGGDTLWAVETTDTAVYVGGHNRWMNNGSASDRIGQGAVARPGIAALDPKSGLPFKWNPGRNPRGAAVFDLHATADGLWMASDTDWVGNFKYNRPKIAFFPTDGGAAPVSDATASLPGTLFVGGPSNSNRLTAAPMTTSTVASLSDVSTGGIAWNSVRGSFLAGGRLFYGMSDGSFRSRTFDGSAFGAESQLTPWSDPVWNGVPTGSGSTTYDGAAPTFYSQISSLTGLTYANNRIYFTRSGDRNLYWRWFSVESGIIGSDVFVAANSTTWSSISGLVAAGGRLYYASSSNGRMSSVDFSTGVPTGSAVSVSSPDLRGRAMFLASTGALHNEVPTASFTATCTDLACDLDASASVDTDGSIATYGWDFGDGGSGAGVTTDHPYAEGGTRTITLTVTDDDGATDTFSQDVQLVDTTSTAVTFVDATSVAANKANPGITVPAGVQAGDTVLLTATLGSVQDVAAPAGWTLLQQQSTTGLTSYVWTRVADANLAGSTVTLTLPLLKSSLAVAAYRGVDASAPVGAHATSTDASTATHTSPTLEAAQGSWIVSLYADKSAATSAWTEPAGTLRRAASFSTGTGRVSTLLVDGGGAQGATVGGLQATTDVVSTRGIAWTIALTPAD